MIKNIFGVLLGVFIASNAWAIDLCYMLPDAEINRITAGFAVRYPNTECEVYDNSGAICLKYKYTDKQWVMERTRRFLRNAFKAGEKYIAAGNSYNAMSKDHDIIIRSKNTWVME